MNLNWRDYAPGKPDPYWRASRIAARILLKRQSGRPLSTRDRRLCRELTEEPGVTNRLIDQALSCLKAPTKI